MNFRVNDFRLDVKPLFILIYDVKNLIMNAYYHRISIASFRNLINVPNTKSQSWLLIPNPRIINELLSCIKMMNDNSLYRIHDAKSGADCDTVS